ncbi:hypothetical protein ACIG87_31390 [Micromonospora sp. NPDC051925]|uniref:hypothetical protein n=1 Tax=Micromonospora sp. NPDC051925 TaxID=3364288 RepID=UPI0037CC4719
MYTTVTRDGTGRIVVYGPHDTPAIARKIGRSPSPSAHRGPLTRTTGPLAEA